MPPTYTTTTRYLLRKLAGSNVMSAIDDGIGALADDIDSKFAGHSEGPFSSRPTSTGGSPGIAGRTYKATDTGVLYIDNGVGWDQIISSHGKSIIATTESRSNTAYGLLTTPDRVQNIVLPTDGIIAVAYQAQWQQSVVGAARAAIFIGANQLKVTTDEQSAATVTAALMASGSGLDAALASYGGGLAGADPNLSLSAPVTTGQAVGHIGTGAYQSYSEVGALSRTLGVGAAFGPCYIFAAAGTYDISVQFKASSGSVTAKNRSLWVWTLPF